MVLIKMDFKWIFRMEPVALRLLEHHLPLPATSNLFSPVTPFGFITHDKHPWLGASIDGVLGDGTIVEVKCPQTYGKVGLNVPPELIYWVQIQIQLETLSLPRAILYKSQFVKYPNIDMWLADTSTLFKGLHLLPRKENIEPIDYQNGNGEEVDFVSPPEEVVPWMVDQPMPPKSRNGNWLEGPTVGGTYDWSVDGLGRPEYDYGRMVEWLTHTMSGRDAGEVCKPILWGLESWTVQEVLRDEEWFRGVRPVLREWWEKIREEVQVRRRGDGVQKSGVDRIEASMGSFRQVLGS
ncbi:hypothetical protein HK097_010662 [Rhizophlyctis rosea]|uniref:YqaJ viral recombinase domain-containing protein n=1 Tax=Rhizophlyctis rosea TaxID=64517 RepID=A0AAD5SP76_9FUNG|nr:hypothetical protein HK097_010662 [Rhizophlyctis rosea]